MLRNAVTKNRWRRQQAQMPQVVDVAKPRDVSKTPLASQLLKKLEFKVLRRLDGFLFGDYSGLFYGPSLDLAEVREYQAGDDVKNIDWNVTARTDKVHVRQYREEREIIAWLIVDLSPSMDFGTRRVLKKEEALEFAGVASSILTRQGNKIGAIGFSQKGMSVVPLGSGRKQSMQIIDSLLQHDNDALKGIVDKGTNELSEAIRQAGKTLKRRALIFVLSDFITASTNEEPSWAKELRRLAFKHDVIAVRISDPAEKELPNVGDLRLRDPETNEEMWVDTSNKQIRREHKKLVLARDQLIQRTMKSARVDLLELSTHEDIVSPLLKFTLQRKGRRG